MDDFLSGYSHVSSYNLNKVEPVGEASSCGSVHPLFRVTVGLNLTCTNSVQSRTTSYVSL